MFAETYINLFHGNVPYTNIAESKWKQKRFARIKVKLHGTCIINLIQYSM